MKSISNEGERIVETDQSQSASEHLHRYILASNYCNNKIVVDIACGEGYGSMLLSKTAQKVFGFDVSQTTINHAKSKYSNINLIFNHASATSIPLQNSSVDIVVSFETIEHLIEQDEMLTEIKRILKKDGILMISTPDKYVYTDIIGNKNKHHLKELYKDEFISLISKYFSNLKVLGQRFITGSFIYEHQIKNEKTKLSWLTGNFKSIEQIGAPEPEYIIILASNSQIENLSQKNESSIFIENNLTEKIINFYKENSIRYKTGYIVLTPFRILKKIKELILK